MHEGDTITAPGYSHQKSEQSALWEHIVEHKPGRVTLHTPPSQPSTHLAAHAYLYKELG